jgi:hypothetical protein
MLLKYLGLFQFFSFQIVLLFSTINISTISVYSLVCLKYFNVNRDLIHFYFQDRKFFFPEIMKASVILLKFGKNC